MEEEAKRKFSKIVSVGGGAKNKEWLQMQADILLQRSQHYPQSKVPAWGRDVSGNRKRTLS